jgi:hypothetical protein
MTEDQNTLVIRDYPTGLWLTGFFLMIFGIIFLITTPGNIFLIGIELILAFIFFILPKTLIITADKMSQKLTLHYRSLFQTSTKDIPFSEIVSFGLESSHDSDGSTYRLSIRCKDGSVIPLRSYYSSGTRGKQKKADQLNQFLGLVEEDSGSQNLLASTLHPQFQSPSTDSSIEEHITDGVHWRVQIAQLGNSTVTRWFSPDSCFTGGFLLLAQKAAGQKGFVSSLFGGMGKMVFPPLMQLYGFSQADTPGLDSAVVLSPLEPHVEPHFAAFTSNPEAARSILNPWACNPLEDWATRYPLKTFQPGKLFGQLVVLFSPQGLYIANMGELIPEAVEEITNLGIQLVKSQ